MTPKFLSEVVSQGQEACRRASRDFLWTWMLGMSLLDI